MTIKDFLFILLLVFQAFINHTTTQNLLVQIDKLNLALVANVSKITELSEQIHAAKLHQIATTVVEVDRPNDAPLPQGAHGEGHHQALIIADENDALIVIPKSPQSADITIDLTINELPVV